MEFFDNPNIDEIERRNIAFQIVCTLREAINLARKDQNPITYENTLDLLSEIKPSFYDPINLLLKNKNESELVKFYKELAEAKSTLNKIILPIDLINKELKKMEALYKNNTNRTYIKKKIVDLKGAKQYFMPRKVSEHKILNQDFYLTDRSGYFGKTLYENDTYKDYKLDNYRILRLRLLHPDKAEAILGSDMVYEQFDLRMEKVRFVHLQYKVWSEKTLYLNDERMMKQLIKMESVLCKSQFCKSHNQDTEYRLPYCCAFLRPTRKMQDSESKLLTSGIHVPICFIQKLKQKEIKLTPGNCKSNSITSKIFEELFHSNMLGSRWISIKELEDFYTSKNLAALTDSIRVHAQEIRIQTEEEKHADK